MGYNCVDKSVKNDITKLNSLKILSQPPPSDFGKINNCIDGRN